MPEPHYLRGPHSFISGLSGAGADKGGKTALGNWWIYNAVNNHQHPEIGVFFNPKAENFIKGRTARSLADIRDGLVDGHRVFDVRVPEGADTVSVHERLIKFLRSIDGTKIVAHDEAYQYGDSDMLEWSLRQGGNIGDSERWQSGDMQSLVITQHPWDIPEKVAQNAPVKVWVGPAVGESDRYFSAMQIGSAKDKIRQHTGPHKWSVIDGGEYVETNPPVPDEYAGE